MRAMPLSLPGKVVLGVSCVSPAGLWKEGGRFEGEPTSVLDTRASPSPPTSTSTLSGGGGSAGVAAVSEPFQWQDVASGDWPAAELGLEMMGGEKCGLAMDDCWGDMLAGAPASPPAATEAAAAAGGGQEQSFFQWFMGDVDDDPSSELAFVVDPGSGFDPPASRNPAVAAADYLTFNSGTAAMVSPTSSGTDPAPAQVGMSSPIFANSPINLSLPPNLFYHKPVEEKPSLINQQPNQSFFLPTPFNHQEQQQQLLVIPPNPKRHQPAPPFMMHLQNRTAASLAGKQIKAGGDEVVTAAVVEQVVKAGELVEAGNSVHVRGILARLNHHIPSPAGKPPLLRAGFHFSDALHRLLDPSSAASGAGVGAGVVFKIAAYKAFSEVSPVMQFANFTANQVLLEAVHGHPRLHILDFDVGLGGQWSSFLKDLAGAAGAALPAGPPSLKITALLPAGAVAVAGDLLELGSTRENLAHFAAELNIPFDLRVAAVDSLDPSIACGTDEAVAVNLPASPRQSSSLLRLLKQLKPKVVVSLDRGAEQGDLLHSIHSHAALLDSLDATSPSPDALHKIERFLVGPRIEKLVAARHCAGAGEKALPLSAAFAAAGFSPAAISSFAETQAECLVKRVPVKGFHVEKRPPASLCLCWQGSELAAVSAWRC